MYVFNMYNQMSRRVLCGSEGGSEREEPAIAKTCCKQSFEEGMIVSKKVHGCGLARMEVAYVEPQGSHTKCMDDTCRGL